MEATTTTTTSTWNLDTFGRPFRETRIRCQAAAAHPSEGGRRKTPRTFNDSGLCDACEARISAEL